LLQSDLFLLAGEKRNLDINVGALVERALELRPKVGDGMKG
jgi:hypothetical protein